MSAISRKWYALNLKVRLTILMALGFVVGSFVQGEYNSGEFSGVATLAALFVLVLLYQQGWHDGGKE